MSGGSVLSPPPPHPITVPAALKETIELMIACHAKGSRAQPSYIVDTIQDFLRKLGMKPHVHLVEISIFSLNNVIVRPTKIMNRADKNWAHFKEQNTLKIKFLKTFH